MNSLFTVHCGDALEVLKTLPAASAQTCVTSPPYFNLRDYQIDGQIGLEKTPDAFISRLVDVFREVRRVLKNDGTLWVNIGDSYAANAAAGNKVFGNPAFNENRPSRAATKTSAKQIPDGLKQKDLIGIPWMLAFALRADGWYLRSEIIWHKTAPMPESVTDRPTKAHEQVFLLSKSPTYFYDHEAIKEPLTEGSDVEYRQNLRSKANYNAKQPYQSNFPKVFDMTGRNKRSVWTINPAPCKEVHFATYPPALILPCIRAGSAPGDTVLDPFCGSGTTGMVALAEGRRFIGVELNPEYAELSRRRIGGSKLSLFDGSDSE